MAIEYNFTLDMDRSKRDNNIAYARIGDIDSIVINADLVFGGAAYTPSGTNAFFECITPNGRSIRAAAEKTGSSVSVEVPPAAFQAAGVINVAYFRFETGASDNPTYVESTEPFAIIVREGIGDNIDAGDYIEEWRKLADQLEAAVAEVEKKAEQAETAIDEQKTEVDQLKTQAQKAIAGDVTEVEGVAQSAISAINKEKADVADAAEDISAAGEQAINSFNSKGTSAINKFNTDSASAISKFNTDGTAAVEQFNYKGTSAINQFNTNAGSKLDEVDGMITEAQGDVDAAVTQLETATDKAVSAMEDALDGTTAGSLQNAINRTLKLDAADMTNIPDNSSLSSFTNVGSYCCKTAATAATVGDCPIDDSPFNMYVFSSITSGQVMQLVVPIDMNGKPTAEWHVRFGTSSAMDPWSVIGGGADIAAGLGIDVTGDAQKTVSLDTTAFYQHHDAADIIQGSTEVTGGGRIKELTVYGNTKQNLWVNPSGTSNGVTVTSNEDGTFTVSGTGTANNSVQAYDLFSLKPSTAYTVECDKAVEGGRGFYIREKRSDKSQIIVRWFGGTKNPSTKMTFTTDSEFSLFDTAIGYSNGVTISGTYRVMLREATEDEIAAAQLTPGTLQEGGTADLPQDRPITLQAYPDVLAEAQPFDWVKPGINGVKPTALVTSGKNLVKQVVYAFPGTKLNDFTFDDNSVTVAFDAVKGETYTFSSTPAPDRSHYGYIEADRIEYGTKYSDKKKASISGNTIKVTAERSGTMFLYVMHTKNESVAASAQVELGTEATAYEPYSGSSTHLDLKGHQLHMLPDGTRDELCIDGTGAVTLVQRVESTNYSGGGQYIPASGDKLPWMLLPYGQFSSQYDDFGGTANILCNVYPIVQNTKQRGCFKTWNAVAVVDERFTSKDEAVRILMEMKPTFFYKSPKPPTISLGSIAMPDLASPDYIIYASSNIPAEIEADVVKVDYLPASDVYTREEVDKKIEDVGGMPDIVPVSQGGTGVTTAAAERNRLGLGNTTGPLPVANGGTGKTTAKAAQNALLADINTEYTDIGDETFFVGYYQSPSDATGALHKRVGSNVWSWIVGKIRSTFGFSSSNVLPVANGGTGLTKAPSMLVNLESASAANPLASDPRPGVSGELPLTRGGTGGTSAAAARTNLGVYSKAEVDGKVPKVVYGTGNIPSNAENGTIYIQYRS